MNFAYENLSGRPTGPFLALISTLLPPVAAVQDQVPRYAEEWQESNRVALSSPLPLWVALGDSMALGVGASAFDRGWVGQLRDRLAGEGHPYRVVNLSFSGARADDVLSRQLPALAELTKIHTPALVTLLIGSNDLLQPPHRKELPERFERILELLPAGAVVGNLASPRPEAREIARKLHQAETEGRITVADMARDQGSWRGLLASDHFHPNDAGYTRIATTFHRAISAHPGG